MPPARVREAVGPLGGVVTLEGEAHLNDAPAQQDQAHCPDQTENELRQIVDHFQRIIRRHRLS